MMEWILMPIATAYNYTVGPVVGAYDYAVSKLSSSVNMTCDTKTTVQDGFYSWTAYAVAICVLYAGLFTVRKYILANKAKANYLRALSGTHKSLNMYYRVPSDHVATEPIGEYRPYKRITSLENKTLATAERKEHKPCGRYGNWVICLLGGRVGAILLTLTVCYLMYQASAFVDRATKCCIVQTLQAELAQAITSEIPKTIAWAEFYKTAIRYIFGSIFGTVAAFFGGVVVSCCAERRKGKKNTTVESVASGVTPSYFSWLVKNAAAYNSMYQLPAADTQTALKHELVRTATSRLEDERRKPVEYVAIADGQRPADNKAALERNKSYVQQSRDTLARFNAQHSSDPARAAMVRMLTASSPFLQRALSFAASAPPASEVFPDPA